jgi:hypothetical protein
MLRLFGQIMDIYGDSKKSKNIFCQKSTEFSNINAGSISTKYGASDGYYCMRQ